MDENPPQGRNDALEADKNERLQSLPVQSLSDNLVWEAVALE
jgi:hypothetical protein